MPNTFAYIALFSWPLVALLIFRLLPRPAALICTILGGYLLLPFRVGINPPLLPVLDKNFIPALSATILCFLFIKDEATDLVRRPQTGVAPIKERDASKPVQPARVASYTRQRDTQPGRVLVAPQPKLTPQKTQGHPQPTGKKVGNLLLLLLIVTPFITFLQNGDAVQVGPRILPGLRLYDAFSMVLGAVVTVLPFLLARRHLATPERHVLLLRGLCLAGLLYSLPTLLEIRLSPQFSRWVYGFLSQSFAQAMREGGFRPVVFLQHGLWLAIFNAMAALAALSLWRHGKSQGGSGTYLLAGLWLSGVLLLSHSLGAFALLLVLAPIVVLAPVRVQMVTAGLIACVILTYPTLRGAGFVPINTVTSIAQSVSENRAKSLAFRFENENILLAHAGEKPVAGWGGWGRSRVMDAVTGEDISTTDGMWVILIGVWGWLGYLAQFGLLSVPIVLLALGRRQLDLTLATSGLCLTLAANLLDLIPNATLTPITWLIAGALMGRYDIGANVAGGLSSSPEIPSKREQV